MPFLRTPRPEHRPVRVPSRAHRQRLAPSASLVAIATLARAYVVALDRVHTRALALLMPWIHQNALPDHLRADASPKSSLDGLRFSLHRTVDDFEIRALVGHASELADRENARKLRRIPGINPDKIFHDVSTVEAFREKNVGLVKTLAQEFLGDLVDTLERADVRTLHVTDLTKVIQDRFSVSKARAEFWAVDQTLKLNSDITEKRMRGAGISKYVWTGSLDEREREMHRELEGQIFSFDDPPITNEQGDRNNPGGDFRCRCTSYPILEDAPEG